MRRPEPLRRVPSLKAKIGLLIVIAIGTAMVTSAVGYRLGWPIWVRPIAACAISLAIVEVVAHGITSPLRQMEQATERMARGDYAARVDEGAKDEAGRLAAAFNRMAAELAEVERQRRDLVANASHELRTPIAGMQATLENLIDGVLPATPASLLALHGQVERMARLVDDLLELSKLEAGAVPLRRGPVSLLELANTVAADVKIAHPGLRVEVVAGDGPAGDAGRGPAGDAGRGPAGDVGGDVGGDVVVDADGDRLAQVLTNLLANAARYSARATIEVRHRGPGAVVTVTDDGPGIPPGEAGRVFERFYRADRARPTGGAGLGLAICRWIAELHGGTIRAEANEPHGCRMVLELPT